MAPSTPDHLNTSAHYFYQDNTLVKEQVEADTFLRSLYAKRFCWPLRAIARTKTAAQMAGWWHNSRWSVRNIKPFIQRHNIDMTQFQIPADGFASFNDFFCRHLKPGARTIALNSEGITSPADSKLLVIPDLEPQSTFFLKQLPCNLLTLLEDQEMADRYSQGTMLMFRLAPADYHRFHFPFACVPEAPRVVAGCYESVNPVSFKNGTQPLTCNARVVIPLRTKEHGIVTMVAVGAMLVGSIQTTFQPNTEYAAGDEAGYFAFGGSTVVLLFAKGHIAPSTDLIKHSVQGFETAVLMGQEVATWQCKTDYLRP